MYLVILLAAAAILGGVVVVAMGRGGEMALFDPDAPVKIIRLETPGDVATMPLPLGFIGYQARATGEALVAAANLLARRDAEIAALRREIWRLGGNDQAMAADSGVDVGGRDRVGGPDHVGGPDRVGGPDYSAASYAAPAALPIGSEEASVEQASAQEPVDQAQADQQAGQS